MESLLASYGSDEEDADTPLGSPRPHVEVSLPRDQNSARYSIFSSLPPPKSLAPERSLWSDEAEPLHKNSSGGKGRREGFATASPPKNLAEEEINDAETVSFLGGQDSDGDPPHKYVRKSSSLFAHLPPPSSSKPSFAFPPLPNLAAAKVKKKVVEFKPPINLAALETQDEDDFERSRKRSKIPEESRRRTERTGVGLSAMLPPPKNSLGSGAALGGGGAHGGRRTVMETVSNGYSTDKEGGLDSHEFSYNVNSRKLENVDVVTCSDSYDSSNNSLGDSQPGNPLAQFTQNQFQSGDGYGTWNYGEDALRDGSGLSQVHTDAPVIELLKNERRKGREELLPQMIEVKQADLTRSSKLREDQLHTTGIAFGPAYKPMASNKDKPSKLHRRKHQIGALYFDMKQNEMNLLDRRAKGNLSKAETQAKYGW